MGQHHPLRFAFRTGSEQHHRGGFRIAGRGRQILRQQHPEFVEQADVLRQVFQIEQTLLAQTGQGRFQFGGGNEAAGSDHRGYVGRRAGIGQTLRTGGVVQQRRHPAPG